MFSLFRGFKIERSEQTNSFILNSQILGYRVLTVLLLLDYFYRYFVLKEHSQDILIIYFLSISISTIYLAKNKLFPQKWNDVIATISAAGIIMFAVILFIFFYQYK